MKKTDMPSLFMAVLLLSLSCSRGGQGKVNGQSPDPEYPVALRLTEARASDGLYISWKEHLIDGPGVSGIPLSGSDGLQAADLDLDGFPDLVSVHEGDTVYDGIPRGYIRIAFGSPDPDQWELITLAHGPQAGAAEDVAIGDMNGDGWPDILAACELAHLIYFQNPGKDIRSSTWSRVIPGITKGRGSFIRVFCADLDGDGRLEVTAPNKGSQHPGLTVSGTHPISWFRIEGEPLEGDRWTEHVLARVRIPENARPVDLDGDGDLDIMGGSRGEERIMWFENMNGTTPLFLEREIRILHHGKSFPVTGVMVDFEDMDRDGRLDIIVMDSPDKDSVGWIAQPDDPVEPWMYHHIGNVIPDQMMGLVLADINGDGLPDLMTGCYSSSARKNDEEKTIFDVLGRLAWFEHPSEQGDPWIRHDVSRRIRSMFDQFVPMDLDRDGDLDFITTRGNSFPYDGVLWLEQVRTTRPVPRFEPARENESRMMGLPVKHH